MVSSTVKPQIALAGFTRVTLAPGETKQVSVTVGPREMRTVGRDFTWRIEPGEFRLFLGDYAEQILMTRSFRVR